MAWRFEVLRFVPHLNRAKQQWPSRKSVKTKLCPSNIVILTWTFQKKTLIVWWIFLRKLASLDALESMTLACISTWNMADTSPGSLVWLSELPTFLSSSMGQNSPFQENHGWEREWKTSKIGRAPKGNSSSNPSVSNREGGKAYIFGFWFRSRGELASNHHVAEGTVDLSVFMCEVAWI